MTTAHKLTKKQKKALVFRERKTGKRKDHNVSLMDADDSNDVPAMEDQDMVDAQDGSSEVEMEERRENVGSHEAGKEKAKPRDEQTGQKPKKRQREREEITEQSERKAKRAKILDDVGKTDEKKVTKTQRFLLFVGNLKYTTPLQAIQAHFGACDPPPAIRLLTPKSVAGKPSRKSKGCAFLEFSHRNALQQALKLHQSELDGRMINVELTAGGGGRNENRLEKLRQRNKDLLVQRKFHTEKEKPDATPTFPDKPQRYSTTSGIDQGPVAHRTWTVGDNLEGETHRGGKKHARVRQIKRKTWGTGVNAIPVS